MEVGRFSSSYTRAQLPSFGSRATEATEDVEAILEGLRQAEFDHIYPANPTLFDRFLASLGEAGVRETCDGFPDPRQRRSILVRGPGCRQ